MKNWRTTAAGLITGAIPLAQGIAASLEQGAPIHWQSMVLGIGIMVLGVLSRDFQS